LSIRVDLIDQASQSLIPLLSDLSQAFPKFVFNADSRLATSNDYRALLDREFHGGRDEMKLAPTTWEVSGPSFPLSCGHQRERKRPQHNNNNPSQQGLLGDA
jgi:hypothetical protein